jgi:invasion protein IalB
MYCLCGKLDRPGVSDTRPGRVQKQGHRGLIRRGWNLLANLLKNAVAASKGRLTSGRLTSGRLVVLSLLGLVGLASIGGSAQAQTADSLGVLRSTHDNWQVRCDTPPGAQQEQCALVQAVTASDRPNVALSVLVLKTADQKSRLLRVLAPLGVLLPRGLGLKIDGKDVGSAQFMRCLPSGCLADIILDDPLIGQMRTGKDATFIIFQTPEDGIGIPLTLKGFGEGFDELK